MDTLYIPGVTDPDEAPLPKDTLAMESARLDEQLKAVFKLEAEFFERQLVHRNMRLNARGTAQLELNLREFLNKAIADIERDLDDVS